MFTTAHNFFTTAQSVHNCTLKTLLQRSSDSFRHLVCIKITKMSPPDVIFELEIHKNAFAVWLRPGPQGHWGTL